MAGRVVPLSSSLTGWLGMTLALESNSMTSGIVAILGDSTAGECLDREGV